ncbi:PepSY-associated TM helix domain-containing protein [Adhaeribacter soli]|uniref:PepSY domain-containing protein n=1 Tax=Adhaeribacter soli TaxID=2607655 RepID=A0A5N1IIM7_9BACT|nr:PepSY-associated TM helix domain-containing protein [Adhaeribacter soli]KAA9324996.1 PepSY domain-containing protein [Adhaeribacter soli]
MKIFFRNIHLYLSLAAGLVIAVVCFTGAALTFEKELNAWIYPERYHVQVGTQKASLDQMVAVVKGLKPEVKVSSVKVFNDPTRTIEIGYTDEKEKAGDKGAVGKEKENGSKTGEKGEQKGEKGKGKNGKVAYFNPYTGELIATSGQKTPFFQTMFGLHRWLLVQGPGKIVVGVSTIFFLFIIATGIVLWWPKNKKILKQRLTMKWDGGWKRLNHDLHLVIGFYTAIFLFAFAFTGLVWSFEWYHNAIYTLTGTTKELPEPPLSTVQEGAKPISFEQAYAIAKAEIPGASFYNLSAPKEADAALTVNLMPKEAAHERANTQLFLDQYSGNVLGKLALEDKNLGQRIRAAFYPIHVGSIGGLPGRIIAFISCIAGFTFPITGLILWLNRLKKEKKKSRKKTRKKAVLAGTNA